MADINTNLTDLTNNANRIAVATSAIANAIVAKGGTLPENAGLQTFANAIENIPLQTTSIKTDTTGTGIKFIGDGNPLIRCDLEGNMQQTGTPTPQNPIQPSETGDKTENLFDDHNIITIAGLGDRYGVVLPEGQYSIYNDTDNIVYDGINDFQNRHVACEAHSTATVTLYTEPGKTCGFLMALNAASQGGVTIVSGPTPPSLHIPYGYYLPTKCGGTTTPVYLGEVQSTRIIGKYEFTGQENWIRTNSGYFYTGNAFSDYNNTQTLYRKRSSMFSHYIATVNDTNGNSLSNGYACLYCSSGAPNNYHEVYIRDNSYATADDFKTYLAQQYSTGTPVTVWYVLAEPTTGVVNEPIRKIGDYVDSISVTGIPTVAGLNEFQVTTTLPPSKATIEYCYIENVPTLDSKTITINGTYNASDDNLDGYSSVTVEVPNSYVAGDEGKVVSNGALVAQTAYPTELKDNDTYDTTNYNSVTVNVPARGYNHGGVNFFDVDGTILYSYTSEEFLALTEMPPNPDRSWDWLTAQGWNWTLSDAKTYVTNYGALNIGQHYITIDNKTAIHVLLPDGCLNPQLGLYLSGTVDIDWGDETVHETLTGSSSSYQYATHTYAEPGRYYILITVTSGTAIMKGGNSANKLFCKGGLGNNTPGNESKKYTNCIQDIHIGANMDIGAYAFYRCYSMKHISIPSTVRSISNSTFQWNSSLQAVVIPEGVTALGTSTFEGCYGLRFVSTPKSLTSVGQKCFSQCYSVIALTFSNSLTSVDQKCFVDCPSCDVLQTPGISGTIPLEFCARNRTMMDFVIPEGVTAIGQDAFTYCYGLMNVTVPSTLRTTGTNAFSYCQALNTITFPDEFTTMAASTFESCSALQAFTIPSGMTEIPQKAFKSCASLCYIRIPWTITAIGTEAFSTCSGLSYIQFEGNTPPTLTNSNTFASLETDCVIFVPKDYYSTYISASYYPSSSTYTYCIFETYTSGRELPNMISSDKTYDLTWYASQNDAISQTNPITEGNGKEVYARIVERV